MAPRRRRRGQGLERVLGAPALFATVYGNVGSSIYYALGVTAIFALGLTPVVSPEILVENMDLGMTPKWGDFLLAIPVAMIAYTGIETVSNLAEEARDPVRNVPRAYLATVVAVFAIFFTLPAIALSALPVREVDGERTMPSTSA